MGWEVAMGKNRGTEWCRICLVRPSGLEHRVNGCSGKVDNTNGGGALGVHAQKNAVGDRGKSEYGTIDKVKNWKPSSVQGDRRALRRGTSSATAGRKLQDDVEENPYSQ